MSFVTVSNTSKLIGKTTETIFLVTAMSIVTISKASKLVGKSTQTLYRHISSGKLHRKKNGIETAELIRVYGELQMDDKTEQEKKKNKKTKNSQIKQFPAANKPALTQMDDPPDSITERDNILLEQLNLREQIRDLQEEIREMRELYEKKEDRLLRIIELNLTGPQPKENWLKKFFK